MREIVDPESPAEIDPAPPNRLAGDWKDDDGQALDDYFEAGEIGPPAESESAAYEREEMPPPTRLLSRRVTVGTNSGVLYDPALVFPADVWRCGLVINADGPIYIGSEKSDCYGSAIVDKFPFVLDAHTGALWVYSVSGSPVFVDVVVTTK